MHQFETPCIFTGGAIRTISESVSQKENAAPGVKTGRHAVIRRHQSMYIHPRATELLPPFNTGGDPVPNFNMQEVSGQSEVRPIVTLKRSKTTVGTSNTTMHYRGAATLQPPRTFRSNSNKMKFIDHNVYGTNKRKHYANPGATPNAGSHLRMDDICEFQVSFSHFLYSFGDCDKAFLEVSKTKMGI